MQQILSIKKNFYLPRDLAKRTTEVAQKEGTTFSEFVRRVLTTYLEQNERKNLERELIHAYTINYDDDKKITKEWGPAEAEV